MDDRRYKTLPIGYILSLEGADSLVRVDYLDRAWDYGPWTLAPGRYAHGTNASGAMGKERTSPAEENG